MILFDLTQDIEDSIVIEQSTFEFTIQKIVGEQLNYSLIMNIYQ